MITKISKKAFTLIEVILAVGIFAIAVVAMIGLFSGAVSSVDSIDNHDEVILSTSRMDETINSLSFETVYKIAREGALDNSSLFFYNIESEDGLILPQGPFELDRNGQIEESRRIRRSDVVSAIENGEVVGNSIIAVEIPPISDTQNRPVKLPQGSSIPSNPDSYSEAVVSFHAKFYVIPISNFLHGNSDLTEEGAEIFTYPIAKNR